MAIERILEEEHYALIDLHKKMLEQATQELGFPGRPHSPSFFHAEGIQAAVKLLAKFDGSWKLAQEQIDQTVQQCLKPRW